MVREITFRIIDWYIEEIQDAEMVVHLSGLNKLNQQIYCKVLGFRPHCYLELPITKKWNKTNASILFEYIQKKIKECPPDSWKLETRKLDMYSLRRQFLRINFNTKNSYRHLGNTTKYPWKIPDLGEFPANSFKLHEQNINDEVKFGIRRDIDPSGWISVKPLNLNNATYPKNFSKCHHSIYCDARKVKRSTRYTQDDQIDPLVCSYDIELHSVNRKSSSPTPEKEGNVITMITLAFGRTSQPFEKWDIHTVSLYDCEPRTGVLYDCGGSEKKLLKMFAKIVRKMQPDVITGYNINGFDWGAILIRAKLHGLISSIDGFHVLEECFQMGKLKESKDFIKDISWGSSARGSQEKKYVKLMGVLNFDLFTEVSFNYKLPTYKLAYVSSKFLGGETKDDMPYQQMFILHDMTAPLYKTFNDGIDLDATTAKKMIMSEVSKQELVRVPGLVNHPADMADEVYRAKSYKKLVRICKKYWKLMVDYCIQDTILVPKLVGKLNSLVSLWENSNICKVPASFVFDRGQQIKVTAQLVDECYKTGYVFSYRAKKKVEEPEESDSESESGSGDGEKKKKKKSKKKYQGGAVMKAQPGLHERVAILDFASLYPSIMRAKNMCYTTYRLNDDPRTKDEECYIADWEEHKGCEHDPTKEKRDNILCGHNRYRFLKPVEGKPETQGILPRMLSNLLAYRKRVKGELKGANSRYKELLVKSQSQDITDEEREEMNKEMVRANILDSRQLAIKVNANSVYGYTGTGDKGVKPCEPIAASVTYYSRYFIKKSEELVCAKWSNAEVIYGDTDSIFVVWHGATLEETFALAKEAADYLTDCLPEHLIMEDENVYDPCFCITKKKYEYKIVDKFGNVLKEGSKGSMNTRRDNCDCAREIYTRTRNSIMELKSLNETVYEMNEGILDMFRGKYPLNNFVIYMGLKKNVEDYAQKSGHVRFAERLIERGNDIKANTRLEFVMVKVHDKKAKSGDRMEDWGTFLMNRYISGQKIDFAYYVEHNLVKPITKVLNIAYPNVEKDYMKPDEGFKMSMQCYLKPKWATLLKGLPLWQKALYIMKWSRRRRMVESARRYYSEWVLESLFKRHGLPYRYLYRKRPGTGKTIVYQNDRIVLNIARYHIWWGQVVNQIPEWELSVKLKRVK